MNKYQEALDELVFCKKQLKCSTCKHKNLCTMERDSNIIQELVDKETPTKPQTNKYGRGSEWVCPNCKSHIAYFDELGIGTVRYFKYCSECGQRLDLGCNSNG